MRTKHILTALALPALFAACTADEFVNEDFGKVAERAKVSKNFSLVTSEDATTRYAVDGETSLNFTFEKGDKIGAAIIDQMDPDIKDPAGWPIIPSLAGNYPFEFDGSQWNSATTLGIGHYLFVYPYDKNDNNRAAVSYSLPTVQKLYGEDGKLDLNAAIENGDKAVFASVLYEGDTQLAANLQGLYTYPKFVINFDNGLPITSVSKVVLEYTNGEGFEVKGGFNHEEVAKLFAEAETTTLSEKEYWNSKQTADFLIQDGDYINGLDAKKYTDRKYSKYLIAELPANTPVKVNSITNNKYIEVRFMMPGVGADGTGKKTAYEDDLELYIYTDNGIYKNELRWDTDIQWKEQTSATAKANALVRGKSNTLTLKKIEKKDEVDLTIVTNIADWNALVDAYGATTAKKISIVGDEFFFDSTVKMPSKAIFTVTTPVSVKGEVELSNIDVNNTVTVEADAALTAGENLSIDKVVNKGELTFIALEEGSYSGIEGVQNEGKVVIPAEADVTFKLFNAEGAEVENNGILNVQDLIVEVKDEDKWGNYGIVTNKGTMNILTSGFTNAAREYKGEELINEPVIKNAEKGKILAKKGNLTNASLIDNNGTLTCKNAGGKINNQAGGVLDSHKAALTYITNNEGKIIVYSNNPDNLTIGGTKGIVEYTTSAPSESFEGSLVNTVIASKDYAVTKGTLTKLTIEDDAKLTVGTDKTNANIGTLVVNGGKTTLGRNLTVTALTVAKGAMVVVPEKMVLTISTAALENEGIILVGGTFNATSVKEGEGGAVEENGSGSEINWEQTEDEKELAKAKKAYEDAMAPAIGQWIAKGSGYTATVDNLGFDIINGKNGSVAAKDLFKSFIGMDSNKNGKVAELWTAFNAYYTLNTKAKITDYYATAAETVVAKIEESNEFKTMLEGLTWTVKAANAKDHIYKNDAEGTENKKTAEEKAIAAFKAGVADGEVTGVSVVAHKVALCSSENNHAPEGSQVFVNDIIYTIFGENAIGNCPDWEKAGLSEEFNKKTEWGITKVRKWIEEVAGAKESSLYLDAAKKFVKDNNLVVAQKNWKYQSSIIKAIAAEQLK